MNLLLFSELATMKMTSLGHTDLYTAPIIFGGNVFGWTIDEQRSVELLDAFTAAGFNMIDTADVYSRWAPGNKGGESETIIGNWLAKRKNRTDVIIATKVGSDLGDGKKGLRKDYILRAAEDSLRRLQTDHIDLYQTHFDEEEVPVEEMLSAYDELIRSGKVRWIGTSNMSPARIEASLETAENKDLPRYQTLQPHYNLSDRKKFETEYAQLSLKHNLSVIPYFSLASGFLTGKYRTKEDLSKSARGGDMDKHFNARGYAILDALDTVSAKHHVTQAAIALAWLLAQPAVAAPIASATNEKQLNDLMKTATVVLDENDMALLNKASD